MSSTLERIQKLEEAMSNVVNRVTSPDPMVQMLSNKVLGVEQSATSIGKMLSAIAEELTETKVLNSTNVMIRLRKAEDENSRSNIKGLLSQDVIESSEIIDETSLVALEQKTINTSTGETTVIAEYNLVSLNSPATDPTWKTSLIGKKVGDTVKGVNQGSEEEILTVKEVYNIKEKEVEGEPPVPPTDEIKEEKSN